MFSVSTAVGLVFIGLSKAWCACVAIFLLAWSAIRTALHSPCISHEGGVKDIRLLAAMLRQDEGCHLWWQPSPFGTLDKHICFKWWSSFGVSWGSHQATAVTEAWSSSFAHTYSNACLCSDNQLGSNVLTFSLALIAAENCTRHIRIGPHRFPCASTTFVYIYTK